MVNPPAAAAAVEDSAEASRRGLDRMVFFSDAVVAIAITLVMLPLVDAAREFHNASAWVFIQENWLGLVAVIVSFYAIARIWMAHHSLYLHVTGYTRGAMWLNLGWLACVMFLPLATVLMVNGIGGTSIDIYIAALVIAMGTTRVQAIVLQRAGYLKRPTKKRRERVAEWTAIFILILGMIVIGIFPSSGAFSLLLLLLTRPISMLIAGTTKITH